MVNTEVTKNQPLPSPDAALIAEELHMQDKRLHLTPEDFEQQKAWHRMRPPTPSSIERANEKRHEQWQDARARRGIPNPGEVVPHLWARP